MKIQALTVGCLVGLMTLTPGWASPFDVPGEQIEGSLVISEDSFSSHRSELTTAEMKSLGIDRGATKVTNRGDFDSMPPIMVMVEERSIQQVPVTIRVATPVAPSVVSGKYRRPTLASRGAAAGSLTFKTSATETATVYRSVSRMVKKQLDITPIIEREAERNGLDPWLLRGIIETESAFRPYARSCVGAGGLMQLMPGTASYLGCQDRFDPSQNIAAGAKYIRMMYQRFGDYDLAIAAYNAGPGNVERYGGVPPFAETQNYVRKVRRAWQWRPAER